ncbi:MAG: hypothetical protein LBP59_04340 [Planctomycetaceae bacterium]|nr:hypothetical protein [Planctomycetaceae bacterium]
MRLYSTANERGLDRNSLFVCLAANCRRDARDPLVSPAFQDRGHFRIACILGSQAFRLGSFRFAGETPASQDRGRLACMRLYSTANERGLDRNRLFVCLAANCRRDARDPLVSPAFQDRGHFRIACMRLYSTANERGLDRNRLFVCLAANCRRDARDPLVSPAFSGSRAF